MANQTKRPVNLDLLSIRLPMVGIASIFHRVSGVLLFFAVPFLLYLWELSLSSPEGFAAVMAMLDGFIFKLFVAGMVWGLVHHFCAGIRYLLLDIDVGVVKEQARASAFVVTAIGALAGVVTLVGLLL